MELLYSLYNSIFQKSLEEPPKVKKEERQTTCENCKFLYENGLWDFECMINKFSIHSPEKYICEDFEIKIRENK